jgi:hypothetical protein
MALSVENKIALKIAHLGMIQGAIARMSGFSATAKTFTVTILAGLAAISLQANQAQLGLVALLATLVLGVIDIYYLTLELRFRAYYEHVESRNLDRADDLAVKPLKRSGDIMRALNSASTKLFYLPIFVACLFFIGYGMAHDWWTTSERFSGSTTPRVERFADDNAATAAKRSEQFVDPTKQSAARAAGQSPKQGDPVGTGQSVQPAATNSAAPN